MYYNKKKLALSIMWIVLGVAFLTLSITGICDDSIFAGIGGGWIGVGLVQVIRNRRYNTNEEYKEKIDIESTDERNRFIRMKAWSLAGYLFILISGITCMGLMIAELTVYGQIVCYCMCAVLCLYWISYMILQKKY